MTTKVSCDQGGFFSRRRLALRLVCVMVVWWVGMPAANLQAAEQTSRPMYSAELSRGYVEDKRYEDALRVLMEPDAYGSPGMDGRKARLFLARQMQDRYRHAAALAKCREVLAMTPSPAEARDAQALSTDALIALGRLKDAEALLTQLRTDETTDDRLGSSAWRLGVGALIAHDVPRASRWLAWVAEPGSGHPKKSAAVDLLRWMAEERAAAGGGFWSPAFLLKLGDLLVSQNEYELGEKAYAAIAKHWRDWRADVVLSKRAFNQLSISTEESAAFATQLLKQLAESHADSPLVPPALIRLHFLYYNYNRDFELARQSLQKVVKRYPASPEAEDALFYLAAEQKRLGHREAAIALFVQVLTDYPASRWASGARVNVDRLTGKRSD